MKTYQIKVDGKWYCGDGEECRTQITPAGNGFHQMCNHGESGIRLSRQKADAWAISSVRNLKSHLDKILRCVQPARLEIVGLTGNSEIKNP